MQVALDYLIKATFTCFFIIYLAACAGIPVPKDDSMDNSEVEKNISDEADSKNKAAPDDMEFPSAEIGSEGNHAPVGDDASGQISNSAPTEKTPSEPTSPNAAQRPEAGQNIAEVVDEEEKKELDLVPVNDAQTNFNQFKNHMANLLAGHVEAVFVVKKESAIHASPDKHSAVLGFVQQGDDIHALSIKKGWVQIGEGKYIPFSDLYPNKRMTAGTEIYKEN